MKNYEKQIEGFTLLINHTGNLKDLEIVVELIKDFIIELEQDKTIGLFYLESIINYLDKLIKDKSKSLIEGLLLILDTTFYEIEEELILDEYSDWN